jgi:polyisoprenyl-phosphate glycosyltransferase
MKRVDLVLPVYNEAEGIEAFHQALVRVLDTLGDRYAFTVTYVLDPSPDHTLDVLKRLAEQDPKVTVVHLSRRFGHQMSLVAGIDQSQGDAVVMMDCDLQHPPELIPLLLQKFEEGYDIVHTSRQYDERTSVWKHWLSRLFYRLQNVLSPVAIQEGAADFRLISRKVTQIFQSSVREQNQFLRGLFQWVGFRSTSVKYTSPPRLAGRTKYRPAKLLAFSVLGITSFSKLPLRIAVILGFLMSAAGMAHALWLIGVFLFAGHLPPGYTSLIVLVTFIGGLQLVVLGIIGEYLGSVFDEVKRRPLYIVDEVVHGRHT